MDVFMIYMNIMYIIYTKFSPTSSVILHPYNPALKKYPRFQSLIGCEMLRERQNNHMLLVDGHKKTDFVETQVLN